MFRNESGIEKTEAQIRSENPSTSFPTPFKADGWEPILKAPKPAPSSPLKIVVKTSSVQDANGNWVEGYEERDRFQTDEEGTKEEKETAYLADIAEKEKASQIQEIEKDFEAEVSLITQGYSQSEIDSWPEQIKEAEAWEAAGKLESFPTPIADAAIAQNGRTKAVHLDKVLVNAAGFRAAFGNTLGKKQKRIMDLDA